MPTFMTIIEMIGREGKLELKPRETLQEIYIIVKFFIRLDKTCLLLIIISILSPLVLRLGDNGTNV